jgi:integrase
LAENTVRRRCGRAKQVFRAAIKGRLIERNPFAELKTAVNANAERFEFISAETVEKVIEAAPNAEWRLLIALARYGGLRTPSEPLKLRWSDIDWERQRIRVPSPKTEHHAGKGSRTIPIFPELKPYLDDVWELSDKKSSEFVITRYRDAASNLRTHFNRIIENAGVEPWGKPWQNMRASRETELTKEYPLHVVTSWMGNSQPVAMKHYLHVLDSDFERAIIEPTKSCADSVQRPSASGSERQKDCTAKPAKARESRKKPSETDTRNCPTRTRT